MSRLTMAAALTFLLVPMAAAPEDSPQTPQIRVSTRLVEVGVIVRDKNGPLANLSKGDFTILDGGKPRAISIFSTDAALAAQQPPERALPQNTFSDVPHYGITAPRSITIVLLDNLNTLYGSTPETGYESTPYWMEDLALQNARAHLIQFVEQLQPEDRVAIYGLTHSLHVLCDFTSDRDQLLAILDKYNTRSVTNRAVVEPGYKTSPRNEVHPHGVANGFENGASSSLAEGANGDRAAETMAALEQIAAHVANIPGRKNLVWLTANLPFSGAAMAHVLSPANIAVYPVDARGLLAKSMATELIPGTADGDEVSGAIGHYDNMPAQSAQPIGITTMEKLAEETGGQAFVNTNDLTAAIRKAVEDSAVTYTLGFYINRDALDGKFHEIKVEVRGQGLIVRYPKGYFAFPDTAPTKNEEEQMAETALQSPIESSMISLHATLDRVNQPQPNSLSLSCSIDIRNLRLVQSGDLRKGAVIVYVFEQDPTGRVLYQWGKGYSLQINDGQYATLLKSGMMFHQYLHPKPAVTTLRVLVEDASTSQLGSLIIPLSQVN